MKQTIKFRLYPTASQEQKLHEIFTIYNKVKRVGYKLFYVLKDTDLPKNEKRKMVQPQLMELCHNNPYVNSILIDCETKLAQQQTWFEKRGKYINKQVETTSFKTSEVMKKALQMKHVLNSVTSEQPDNLGAGLSYTGKVDDWNKIWNFVENCQFFINDLKVCYVSYITNTQAFKN